MEEHAVITGDIINSRKIVSKQGFYRSLEEIFWMIEKYIPLIQPFETFRGDSFQGVVNFPHQALRAAILVRAGLRCYYHYEVKEPLKMEWDARVAIGIGSINYKAVRAMESDGSAFIYSGETVDRLHKSKQRLGIHTPWAVVNEEFKVGCAFTDHIISRWSPQSARVAFEYFLKGESQQQIARLLGITQPAVHKRMAVAQINEIELLLLRFEDLLR